MRTELAKRLRDARDLRGLSQAKLAELCGWESSSRIGNYEQGTREPTFADMRTLALALWVSEDWLITGNQTPARGGNYRLSETGVLEVVDYPSEHPMSGKRSPWDNRGAGIPVGDKHVLVKPSPHVMRPVTLWDSIDDLPHDEYLVVPRMALRFSTGTGGSIAEPDPELDQGQAFRSSYIRRKRLSPKGLMSAYATGDSMEPRIRDGDALLIDTTQRDVIDGKVYAMAWGDDLELKAKRLYKLPGGGLLIRSDNRERYPEITVSANDLESVQVLGRVVLVSGDV